MVTSTGSVVDVDTIYHGSHLTVAAASGTSVLTLETSSSFSPTGGMLDLDGTPTAYSSADAQAGAVTLAAALSATLEVGYPVWNMAGDKKAETVWASVDLDDPDAGSVSAIVPTNMTGYLSEEKDYTTPVAVELRLEAGTWRVVRLLEDVASLDLVTAYAPTAYATKVVDGDILNNTWTTIGGWSPQKQDRVIYDFATARWVVQVDGEYDVRPGVAFSSGGGATEKRAIRIHFWAADGTDLGTSREVRIPGDGFITVETSQYHSVPAGTQISIEAWQNSGATLQIRGAALGTQPLTDCTIKRVGPM